MKRQTSKFHASVWIVLSFVAFAAFTTGVVGQNATDKASVPAPREEKFAPGGDFAVVPWHAARCPIGNYKFEVRVDCEEFRGASKAYEIHFLVNENGETWNEISRIASNPKHPNRTKKPGFKPVGMIHGEWGSVAMRLVGVSDNWYEVEVNYETRETMYAPRFGEMWRAVSWALVLDQHTVTITGQSVKILDSVDGKPIPELDVLPGLEALVENIEGDWAKVILRRDDKLHYGWVRWRDGRKFLVRFSLGTELYSG